MSKTVKLVIEIPKEQYEYLAKIADIGEEPLGYFERVIMCGTPLDDVKAEIADLPTDMFEVYKLKSRVLYMLDNIGKESEDKE